MAFESPRPPRRFVPEKIDLTDLDAVRPLFQTLLDRPLETVAEVERWLLDFSELSAAVSECGGRRSIEKSCHTDDPVLGQRHLDFVTRVGPAIEPLSAALQRKFLDCPALPQLDQKRYGILIRDWRVEVDLYQPANIPVQAEAARLVSDYNKIVGAVTVPFDGEERTVRAMYAYGEQTDRSIRQRAAEALFDRQSKDDPALENIFDQLLALRRQIAQNAGMDSYRDYSWKLLGRFDYTPRHCHDFAESVASTVLPLVRKIKQRRRTDLGVETLRPWDGDVDPHNRPPLKPFATDDIARLIDGTRSIFGRLSPALAEQFETIRRCGNLDLEARPHKQTTGYQSWLAESKQAFIFTNAAGRQRDVQTMMHEGGHALHSMAAAVEPLTFLHRAPIEFAEVASIGMELLGSDHFDVFYNPVDAARAKRARIEGIITSFPLVAAYDSFQHWLYENPGHTRQQRTAEWVRLHRLFTPDVDWTGCEHVLEADWLQVYHFFAVPFYYIEYSIAEIGAVQLWLKARKYPEKAVADYRAALQLGGTRPLPELFAAAGIRFDFSAATIGPLMAAVERELESMPV